MDLSKIGEIKRVLIYRLGSLGDTVVALPSFHLIARAFPIAERRVLTNLRVNDTANNIDAILENSGLVHGYVTYPLKLRSLARLFALSLQIRRWHPEVLVYLAEPRGRYAAMRDACFFKLSGIKYLLGVPYARKQQENYWLSEERGFEHEGARLARCLRILGEVDLDDPRNWDLVLTPEEERRAQEVLGSWPGRDRFIACSVGTKLKLNNWGEKNWAELLKRFSMQYTEYGLLLIGAAEESALSERLSRQWSGPKLNLCGRLSPRESAAVLRQATMFVGHDSGPIHLAACVNVPSVGIFGARNKPGVWFPYGTKHRIIYHQTDCSGCKLELCLEHKHQCIATITVDEVIEAMEQTLRGRDVSASQV
jgi:ADP-heptose:LPS heptosyltransferase